MKPRPSLPPGPYLIVGLARSGEAAALALRRRGERVTVIDASSGGERDARAERLRAAGVEVRLDAAGTDLLPDLGAAGGTLIKSPGVPQRAPVVERARALGIGILGELELGWRMLPNPFVAVTGTNGKTTTTEWIGHLHRTAGVPVAVAGNVGTAVSGLAGELDPAATVVCEASSFQLEDTEHFAPEVAVLLNITPDHLDRHGTFEAYAVAKLNAFARQTAEDVAVVPDDAPWAIPGEGERVRFGTGPEADLRVAGGRLFWRGATLVGSGEIALPGEHNLQNAMASAAAALACGLDPGAVAEGLRSFHGVPHRLELITSAGGVAYVNDSKATNVASTLVALRSYAGGVHLIAGGQGKSQDFAPLAPLVAERCAAVYLIGEDGGEIGSALSAAGVPIDAAGDLETAVAHARAAARPGETVLLSPACASFDQYRDFEARGEHFRALALAVAGSGGSA